jgi:hypothetical protein
MVLSVGGQWIVELDDIPVEVCDTVAEGRPSKHLRHRVSTSYNDGGKGVGDTYRPLKTSRSDGVLAETEIVRVGCAVSVKATPLARSTAVEP